MTTGAGALLVAAVLQGAPPAEAPAWCDEAKRLLLTAPAEGDEAWPRYLAVAARLPREADAVLEDARRRAGESGTLAGTLRALEVALADGCRAPPRASDTAASEVRALLEADERFRGEREERDLIDEWKARFVAWLEEVFESEFMRRYAGASRAVYLSALALFVLFASVRLWRARAKGRAVTIDAAEGARIERERRRAFGEWRQEAAVCLEEGDLRGALRCGQLALLARIGEVDERAVTPARTNREVLFRLDEKRREIVAPALTSFETSFYGGAPLDDGFVTSFLHVVDGAAEALGALS